MHYSSFLMFSFFFFRWGGLLLEQNWPCLPGGQTHAPVVGSQVAPALHPQWDRQSWPQNPSGHGREQKVPRQPGSRECMGGLETENV